MMFEVHTAVLMLRVCRDLIIGLATPAVVGAGLYMEAALLY